MTAAHDLARSRRFLTVEDVDLIQGAVRSLRDDRPALVVDLGAGSGTTALSVLCERSADIEVFTVDIAQANLDWADLAVGNEGFSHLWHGVHGSAVEVARWWHRPVDLLLHDAGHGYDDVSGDLEAWLPHLVSESQVWVHDYAAPPPDWGEPDSPGVAQAIDELVSAGVLRELGTAGLGWWGRKA